MYKAITCHTKIGTEVLVVHRLPEGGTQIHKDYGLRIIGGNEAYRSGRTSETCPRLYEFYNLSHLIEGRGVYWTPAGGRRVVEAGQCVLVSPRSIHFYGGYESDYVEDSLCFAGPLADCLFKSGVFRDGIADLGEERKLIPVIRSSLNPACGAQITANIKLQDLLLELNSRHVENADSCGAAGRVRNLMEILIANPEKWWTVSGMASIVRLKEAQFRRVFKAVAGIPAKQYIEQLKIKKAIELMGRTQSIDSIARRLSYSNQFHFSKRFKSQTGMSPTEYRDRILRGEPV